MFDFPASMLWPLLAALVLTGIHVYFGIHVIGRKVIFVDLALAQIAALGAAFGVVMGYDLDHNPLGLYSYSLAFCILAAAVFSITRMKSKEIPHEAVIGIAYAVAVAATMIVLARSPLGPQEFDRMMKGQLLWVTPGKVLVTAGIYLAVGIFHALFWKRFAAFSFGGSGDRRHRWLWDFLFYASFGFVVTSSVAIAGVFLVFSFLIIPAVGALLFSSRLSIRLAIGWTWGVVVSVLGIKVSYETGWPTSPAIVVTFAATLVAAAVVKFVAVAPSWKSALARVGIFATGFALFVGGLFLFRHRAEDPFERALQLAHDKEATHRLTALEVFESFPQRSGEWKSCALTLLGDDDANVRIRAMEALAGLGDFLDVSRLLRDPEDHVRERCVDLLHEGENPAVTGQLIAAGEDEEDLGIRVMMYEVALHLGDRNAVDRLLTLCLGKDLPSRHCEKARLAIRNHVDFQFSLDKIETFQAWWAEHRDKVVWKDIKGQHMFVLE